MNSLVTMLVPVSCVVYKSTRVGRIADTVFSNILIDITIHTVMIAIIIQCMII